MKRALRVLLASERPAARDFLAGLVEKEGGTVVVGQAENAPRALSLTRNLRPDVVILDCYLPHAVGLDQLPMSRAGGLDVAQVISNEIPNTHVLLLDNLDGMVLPSVAASHDLAISISREGAALNGALTIGSLARQSTENPVFARIAIARRAVRHGAEVLSEQALLVGTLALLIGLIMIVTGILLVPGLFVAGAGALGLMLGLGLKGTLRFFMDQGKTR